jgi:hypothetical protein
VLLGKQLIGNIHHQTHQYCPFTTYMPACNHAISLTCLFFDTKLAKLLRNNLSIQNHSQKNKKTTNFEINVDDKGKAVKTHHFLVAETQGTMLHNDQRARTAIKEMEITSLSVSASTLDIEVGFTHTFLLCSSVRWTGAAHHLASCIAA